MPTVVNRTGKPPGAKSLDGTPMAKKSSSGTDGRWEGLIRRWSFRRSARSWSERIAMSGLRFCGYVLEDFEG